MTDEAAQGRALRPLWSMSGGAFAAATAVWGVTVSGPAWVRTTLILLGATALLTAFLSRSRDRQRRDTVLWFVAGLALVGGRGLGATVDRTNVESLLSNPGSVIRARVVLKEGFSQARWGLRSRIDVLEAEAGDRPFALPRAGRLEIRGASEASSLPAPGEIVEVLAGLGGEAERPTLIVASLRLVRPTGDSRMLPRVRDRLAHTLIAAAGTDVARIRCAELAAALALGRRDLIPDERRDRWRRSGFAHLLAVSGLHVGIVGGTVWLTAALLGAGPRSARLVALAIIPSYAVLTGASPSAMRAALMGVIYLGARFLGRAVLPMAAVLLAGLALLVADPSMIAEPGFQLTFVITAALIRWVAPVTAVLRGPAWLRAAIALPLVAQLAAAPFVAWHFRSLIPGALISNLFALPLLPPTVLVSVLASLLAPFWPGGAAVVLSALDFLVSILGWIGAPARSAEMIVPPVPILAAIVLGALGWSALQSSRHARWSAASWVGVLVVLNLRLVPDTSVGAPRVTVLPVGDGAAVVAAAGRDVLLVDAGRFRRQAALLLAEAGQRRLRMLMASHTDEDHIGGAVEILRSLRVEVLAIPTWMASAVETVPLLRAARSSGTRVVPIARGSVLSPGDLRLQILWPPARRPPREENERSLVVRVDLGPGSALITSDIGKTTERRLGSSTRLDSDVLVIPHHGSRGGTSTSLLDAVSPAIALIPAAPGNTHGHPHREVLDRLAARGIPARMPTRDEAAGATWNGEKWLAAP